jgi:hypothetical protein
MVVGKAADQKKKNQSQSDRKPITPQLSEIEVQYPYVHARPAGKGATNQCWCSYRSEFDQLENRKQTNTYVEKQAGDGNDPYLPMQSAKISQGYFVCPFILVAARL